jgi:hypothetical protein
VGHVLRLCSATCSAAQDEREKPRKILEALVDRSRRIHGDAFSVALVYAGLGDNDRAFAWMDSSLGDLSFGLDWAQSFLADLRGDPRFEDFSRRAGLTR